MGHHQITFDFNFVVICGKKKINQNLILIQAIFNAIHSGATDNI